MENKSWILRCLKVIMISQIMMGLLNAFDIFIYVLNHEMLGVGTLSVTRIARALEAICLGIFALPVIWALLRFKPYTGNLLFWYSIVFVWCSSIREVVGFVYKNNANYSIIVTFIFNVAICQVILRTFRFKHPQMSYIND